MSKLSFEEKIETIVKLEGKVVGKVKEVKGGHQYFPKGSKTGGKIYPNRAECMYSLYDKD